METEQGASDPGAPEDPPVAIPPDAPAPGLEPAPEAPASPEAPPAAAPAERSTGRFLRDLLETILVAVLIVLFVTTFIVQNSVIPSASMEDTLLIGDYILVNKIAFAPADAAAPLSLLGMKPVERGDVVVFKYPQDPDTDYIKRVIGLPGDVIEVRDKVLRRNGEVLSEPWAVHRTGIILPKGSPDALRDHFGPVRVPDGVLFVMGDNRDYSRDSREFGFVPRSHVTGRAFVIFWSKSAPPGAFRRGPPLRRILGALRSFHRDVRWGRLFQVIR